MISIISEPSGTGRLAVIFFSPTNERPVYTHVQHPFRLQLSDCVKQQVVPQQKPEEGSKYTLDLGMLANCMYMSVRFSGIRGLLVAEATSHIVLDEKRLPSSRPATSFPAGHIFTEDDYWPLQKSKADVSKKQIPLLFFAVLFASPKY